MLEIDFKFLLRKTGVRLILKIKLISLHIDPGSQDLMFVSQALTRAEIHRATLSKFSLIAEFLIGKLLVKDRDIRVLKLVNLNPGERNFAGFCDS
jgi:hypothetical protein